MSPSFDAVRSAVEWMDTGKDAPRQRVLQFLEALGIPTTTTNTGYLWDGHRLATKVNGRPVTSQWLCHEAGHWLVCPDSRLHLPGYGLGGTHWDDKDVPRAVYSEVADRDEERASILGLLIEGCLGGACHDTWIDHNWAFDEIRKEAIRAIRWLHKHDYIDCSGMPIAPVALGFIPGVTT